ncbi:MAG TPA: efflux RND transporter periplasmic adaptor subunit [Burkholderiales bacterium]
MRKARFWLTFLVLAAALAAGGWYSRNLPDKDAAAATAPTLRDAVAVEAARVVVDTVVHDLRAVGTLAPNEAVAVAPEIAGRVERIAFREGQAVEAGAVLVELDASILRAELAKARSDLALARANHERASALAQRGLATQRSLDEARAALQAAQAGYQLAQARLEKATIRAPLAGVVGLRTVSVGAYVTPGQRIVELSDIDPLKVEFRVPELALSELRRGQAIRVTVDALPGRTFHGEIDAIDPVVDVSGRAIRLRARIANPKGELAPGLFARVQIELERRENALLVPEAAIFAEGTKRYVYRVVDGRALRTPVELGLRRPGEVEVLKGLARGDVVVTAGQQQVHDGARVDVVNSPAAG